VRKPRLLDLFCGAGGAAVGYHRAGFDVVGVDIKPQPNYPFKFIQADAVQFLHNMELFKLTGYGSALHDARRFDAIHASPPCQSFTAYRRKGHGVGDGYPNHIVTTRMLLQQVGLPYVIENVPGAPLHDPIVLCGSSFGLDVRRHRLFESNAQLVAKPCDHSWQTPRFPPATNRTNLRRTVEVGVWRIPLAVQQEAMSVDWMTLPELSEAIPPAYTEWIGRQLIDELQVVSLAA
jgi:DNA (cytosine-5)-methyltransferase 1